MDILQQLTQVLNARKQADPQTSYAASLYDKGLNKILEKVGEEATEVILAAKDLEAKPGGNKEQSALIGEVADLGFHTSVMLVHLEQDPQVVMDILSDRFGLSGIEEKANRTQS